MKDLSLATFSVNTTILIPKRIVKYFNVQILNRVRAFKNFFGIINAFGILLTECMLILFKYFFLSYFYLEHKITTLFCFNYF